jgi:hypothetical protein
MRELVLRLHELDPNEDDRWLTCMFCGLPRLRLYEAGSRYAGDPVQFTTTLRGNGETHGVGVHLACLERQEAMGDWHGVAYFPEGTSFSAVDVALASETLAAATPISLSEGHGVTFETPTETRARLSHERELRDALMNVLSSAVPHPVEHPTMWRAWREANRLLGLDPDTHVVPTADEELERRIMSGGLPR